LAFGVLPLVWISRRIALRDVLDNVGRVGLGSLSLAWTFILLGIVVGASRWRVLALAYGGKDVPGVGALTRHLLVGSYFNMLPGGVAGEGVRAVRMRPHVGDLVTSFNVLVVERISGLLALLAYAAVAMAWLPPGDHTVIVRCFEIGVLFALLMTAGAILLPYLLARMPHWVRAVARVPLIGSLLCKLRPADRPMLIAGAVCLSFLTQGFAILSILTITHGISADLPAIVGVLPLIILVTHVPLVPGGIGQREAAFVYFYGLVGVSAALAIGTSVIVLLIFVSFAVLGGACYFVETLIAGRAADPSTPM
jgi:uncharacterized membrane protein YbhN (UPF0104 family)